MKKILIAICTITLLLTVVSCKKDEPANVPETKIEQEAVVKAGDADSTAVNAKEDEPAAKVEPQKLEEAKDNGATLAIDLCKIGEIPEEAHILNPEIKNAFAGCKEDKTELFNLKLAVDYKFDLAISSLSIQLFQFDKREKLEDTIQENNSKLQSEPKDVKIEDAQELSKRYGIDIKKVTFTTGGNEDTLFHEDYYYTSGEHDYRFETTIHEDELQDLRDKIVQNLVFAK